MPDRYRRKPGQAVTAIQLDLTVETFTYHKWGDEQRARSGDWLVDNNGDIYTVTAETFARTYRQVSPGRWVKVTPIWAEQATEAGSVATQEGRTHYNAGDWLVYNAEGGRDAYAIDAGTFEQRYERDDTGDMV